MRDTRVILASASPRRRELLGQIGLDFEVRGSHVEEIITAVEPGLVVEELSAQKAQAVLEEHDGGEEDVLVIGADTVVSVDGQILGKPSDEKEAEEMLEKLAGRSHEVYTGVTLLYWCGREGAWSGKGLRTWEGICEWSGESLRTSAGESLRGEADKPAPGRAGQVWRRTFHEVTRVEFYPMTKEEISRYVSCGDCMDKAGAYGIQGMCARYIKGIEGDYNNVVGLPVGRLYQEMKMSPAAESRYRKVGRGNGTGKEGA